jgi:hypothetical protein
MNRVTVLPALIAGTALVSGCDRPADGGANGIENEAGASLNLPSMVPVPEPALDRTALLGAVTRAASAQAAGADDTQAQRPLDGRQFEVRIRFGCRGPSKDLKNEWLGWAFDAEQRTLRLRAAPTIASDDPLVQGMAGETEFEAVEGFWIPRPWLLEPVCPANAAIKAAPPSAQSQAQDRQPEAPVTEPSPKWPRVGIAHFYTAADPRTGRRDNRPYESVTTLPAADTLGSQGFNLVLRGRLRAIQGRKVVHCVSSSAESPPDCIVSADIDQVAIERPETRTAVAEWGGG